MQNERNEVKYVFRSLHAIVGRIPDAYFQDEETNDKETAPKKELTKKETDQAELDEILD